MTANSPPAAAPGSRVYAVGDIHGRSDLLRRLHASMREDAAAAEGARTIAVYLGDYVDRGDDSRGVVELAAAGPGPGFETVHLKGNHDDFLLRFLDDPGVAGIWFANGGDATLESYGVVPEAGEAAEDLRDRFRTALPESHRAFFASLRLTFECGDYFFVHAGVRPGVPLDGQAEEDLCWIREEFLDSGADFGRIVVHGHTPEAEVCFRDNRIGVDTLAWATGHLSCVVLTGSERRVLQT